MLVLSSLFCLPNPARQREWLIPGAGHPSVFAKWLEGSRSFLLLRHSGPMLGTKAAKLRSWCLDIDFEPEDWRVRGFLRHMSHLGSSYLKECQSVTVPGQFARAENISPAYPELSCLCIGLRCWQHDVGHLLTPTDVLVSLSSLRRCLHPSARNQPRCV